ncbi:MAG TPA: integrin alpha, partial [Allosphingosinicella sp.]|nr:integrin alpha [Allosphingosinicella sp.]
MADFPSTIDLSESGASVIIQGDVAGDKAGWSVSEAGDVNGDGIGDFILGAIDAGSSGKAYVIFGKQGGLSNIDLANPLAADAGFAITGDAAGDKVGFSVSGGGDYNGDGFDDLVVGAAEADSSTSDYGEVYVVFGKASGFATVDLGGADPGNDFIRVTGDNEGDKLGTSVSFAGDVNADGRDDLVLGAPFSDADTYNGGAAYVIFGQAEGNETDRNLGTALAAGDGFVIAESSPGSYDQFGGSVSGAGDLNGDGFDDFIVGAFQADFTDSDRGAAYVFFGAANPAGVTMLTIRGDASGDLLGKSVSGAGDVNGDGFGDLIVGAYGGDDGGTGAGEAYVIFGKASGWTNPIDLSAPLAAADGFQIIGSIADDRLSSGVSSAGDVNGDGFDDVIVGAVFHDNGEPDFDDRDSGAAYVIFGKADGFGTIDLDVP